jgi:predicted PurR-regulated permease PerM
MVVTLLFLIFILLLIIVIDSSVKDFISGMDKITNAIKKKTKQMEDHGNESK